MAIVKYIQGDIVDTDIKVIAHGVNCQNTMGSGVAKVLYTKWPEVKNGYHEYCGNIPKEDRLGTIDMLTLKDYDKVILNCFTQYNYGYQDKLLVSYDAIHKCFEEISQYCYKIAIPKIGCGLAGGNWEIVEKIINDATRDNCDVYVYYLKD